MDPGAAELQGPAMRGGTVGGGAGGRMDRIMAAEAIGVGLTCAIGVILGSIAMVAIVIRREDKRPALTCRPPDAVARGVRRLTGLGLRNIAPQDLRQVRR